MQDVGWTGTSFAACAVSVVEVPAGYLILGLAVPVTVHEDGDPCCSGWGSYGEKVMRLRWVSEDCDEKRY